MRIIGQMIRVHPLSLLAEVRRKVSLCVTVTSQPIFLSLMKTTNQLTTTKKQLSTNQLLIDHMHFMYGTLISVHYYATTTTSPDELYDNEQ
jgi:hypothetical protein